MPRSAVSQEEKVLEFFKTAELPAAMVVFNLVKGVMKERMPPSTPKPKATRKRAPKTATGQSGSHATSFDTTKMNQALDREG